MKERKRKGRGEDNFKDQTSKEEKEMDSSCILYRPSVRAGSGRTVPQAPSCDNSFPQHFDPKKSNILIPFVAGAYLSSHVEYASRL